MGRALTEQAGARAACRQGPDTRSAVGPATLLRLIATSLAFLIPVPVDAAPCPDANPCIEKKLSRSEVLDTAQKLVMAHKFSEAKPLLAAMAQDPTVHPEYVFLEGFMAAETGDNKRAAALFREALVERPNWTRARLELARSLYITGDRSAADYHFRLAEKADLPPDIARVVAGFRRAIRDKKSWDFSIQLGIAPDTNVNGSTDARTIDLFGLPFVLADNARRKTGLGESIALAGHARIPLTALYTAQVEGSAGFINYNGSQYDDANASLGIGVSRDFGRNRVTASAIFSERVYGGRESSRLYGGKLVVQHIVGKTGELSGQVAVQRVDSPVNPDYAGTQVAAAFQYTEALNKTTLWSVTVTGRYEPLANPIYSNKQIGVQLGFGTELGWGINTGGTVSASYAGYEGFWQAFGATREDVQVEAHLYAGLRSVRLFGFSPSIDYSYARNLSNIPLYDLSRHRIAFNAARYF